jgi:hypothetical protein
VNNFFPLLFALLLAGCAQPQPMAHLAIERRLVNPDAIRPPALARPDPAAVAAADAARQAQLQAAADRFPEATSEQRAAILGGPLVAGMTTDMVRAAFHDREPRYKRISMAAGHRFESWELGTHYLSFRDGLLESWSWDERSP